MRRAPADALRAPAEMPIAGSPRRLSRVGKFGLESEEAPGRSAKNPLLLPVVDLLRAIDVERHPGSICVGKVYQMVGNRSGGGSRISIHGHTPSEKAIARQENRPIWSRAPARLLSGQPVVANSSTEVSARNRQSDAGDVGSLVRGQKPGSPPPAPRPCRSHPRSRLTPERSNFPSDTLVRARGRNHRSSPLVADSRTP